MAITQGEAVFQAVNEFFDVRPVPPTSEWTTAQKESVHGAVFQMFKTGVTSHRNNPSDAELLKYIPGLVNNWVRKDKRLNGGVAYQTKRPGSRTGSGDEMLKNMKLLLSVTQDSAAKEQIELAIAERISALKPKVEVDASKLPEALRHLVK